MTAFYSTLGQREALAGKAERLIVTNIACRCMKHELKFSDMPVQDLSKHHPWIAYMLILNAVDVRRLSRNGCVTRTRGWPNIWGSRLSSKKGLSDFWVEATATLHYIDPKSFLHPKSPRLWCMWQRTGLLRRQLCGQQRPLPIWPIWRQAGRLLVRFFSSFTSTKCVPSRSSQTHFYFENVSAALTYESRKPDKTYPNGARPSARPSFTELYNAWGPFFVPRSYKIHKGQGCECIYQGGEPLWRMECHFCLCK